RRLGGVEAERVLGEVAAVGGEEAAASGVLAETGGEGGDGVGAVVVPRSAREGQSSCDRQRTRGVVERKAEFRGGDLNGGGEAGVEVDVVDRVDLGAGEPEEFPARLADRR